MTPMYDSGPAPFVSVIIPTHRRPKLLERAVASCFGPAAVESIEVIVVANGHAADPLPRSVLERPGVRVLAIADANANAARNLGLESARGQFVRFLDDDDYLLPAGAREQHRQAREHGPDVCSGAIHLVDAAGTTSACIPAHPGNDLVAAVLSPTSTTQPTGHLFRRGFLDDLRWDPGRPHLQDVDWMHAIIRRSEASWIRLECVVGAWQHHGGPRLSTGALKRHPDMALRELATIVAETVRQLERRGRMDEGRKDAAAEALWHCAHHGFPLAPRHWGKVAKAALELSPTSRPDAELYRRAPWRGLNPLLLEWCLAPKRWLSHRARARRSRPG